MERDGFLTWRTNLFDTEPYWVGWYKDMSSRYLESPARKMLILAGRERLDTPLTIGLMQGKFQMVLMNECGHYIHEDVPEEVEEGEECELDWKDAAAILVTIWVPVRPLGRRSAPGENPTRTSNDVFVSCFFYDQRSCVHKRG